MKKIYILLLGYTACLSACFAAGSPSGEFDDCGEKMSGYVAPPTTPHIATQQSAEQGFLTQAPFESVNSADSSEAPQTILKEDESKGAKNTGVESTHIPHLKFSILRMIVKDPR
jgi:hypothetical protein